jgi:threonine/homoserine/homoserine lactone efflux protein
MSFLWDGLLLGLSLSILLGPLFLSLTQTGLRSGFRAGLSVATGIWISDFIVIYLAWAFVSQVSEWIQNPVFYTYLGYTGVLILWGFGLVSLRRKPSMNYQARAFSAGNITGYLVKGFSINTFNPFTFIFWFGLMSTYALTKKATDAEILWLCTAIMATIMTTDTLKVLLAKYLSQRLNTHTIDKINKLAGILFIFFGFVLLFRTYLLENS